MIYAVKSKPRPWEEEIPTVEPIAVRRAVVEVKSSSSKSSRIWGDHPSFLLGKLFAMFQTDG